MIFPQDIEVGIVNAMKEVVNGVQGVPLFSDRKSADSSIPYIIMHAEVDGFVAQTRTGPNDGSTITSATVDFKVYNKTKKSAVDTAKLLASAVDGMALTVNGGIVLSMNLNVAGHTYEESPGLWVHLLPAYLLMSASRVR